MSLFDTAAQSQHAAPAANGKLKLRVFVHLLPLLAAAGPPQTSLVSSATANASEDPEEDDGGYPSRYPSAARDMVSSSRRSSGLAPPPAMKQRANGSALQPRGALPGGGAPSRSRMSNVSMMSALSGMSGMSGLSESWHDPDMRKFVLRVPAATAVADLKRLVRNEFIAIYERQDPEAVDRFPENAPVNVKDHQYFDVADHHLVGDIFDESREPIVHFRVLVPLAPAVKRPRSNSMDSDEAAHDSAEAVARGASGAADGTRAPAAKRAKRALDNTEPTVAAVAPSSSSPARRSRKASAKSLLSPLQSSSSITVVTTTHRGTNALTIGPKSPSSFLLQSVPPTPGQESPVLPASQEADSRMDVDGSAFVEEEEYELDLTTKRPSRTTIHPGHAHNGSERIASPPQEPLPVRAASVTPRPNFTSSATAAESPRSPLPPSSPASRSGGRIESEAGTPIEVTDSDDDASDSDDDDSDDTSAGPSDDGDTSSDSDDDEEHRVDFVSVVETPLTAGKPSSAPARVGKPLMLPPSALGPNRTALNNGAIPSVLPSPRPIASPTSTTSSVPEMSPPMGAAAMTNVVAAAARRTTALPAHLASSATRAGTSGGSVPIRAMNNPLPPVHAIPLPAPSAAAGLPTLTSLLSNTNLMSAVKLEMAGKNGVAAHRPPSSKVPTASGTASNSRTPSIAPGSSDAESSSSSSSSSDSESGSSDSDGDGGDDTAASKVKYAARTKKSNRSALRHLLG
ncbi:hypothetical protein BC828DRAFT_384401 [Blastocladiella britannica]|nr:hypothetical protein BC828DRAFT_384401 [Blastocladiella britannica]